MTNKAIDPKDTSLLWSHDKHAERVYPLDTALQIYLDQCEYKDAQPSETVTMHAFKHKDVDASWLADFALEAIIERFDDEYGDPEGYTEATQVMKDAALAFARAVIADCDVNQVKDVGSVELKVSEWR